MDARLFRYILQDWKFGGITLQAGFKTSLHIFSQDYIKFLESSSKREISSPESLNFIAPALSCA